MLLHELLETSSPLVPFDGDILILGYGSVGQAVLPILLQHVSVPEDQVTVLEKDDHEHIFESRHGATAITYVRQEVTPDNYEEVLATHVKPGGLIINCSVNIDALSVLEWCAQNDVMQIDTSLERWGHQPDETLPDAAQRTLHHMHERARELMSSYGDCATCVVTHGANPGYVSHLTKRALLHIADDRGLNAEVPRSRGEWAALMRDLGIKVVHVAERDSQLIDLPKKRNEFVNTWSCEGFWAEGRAPAEMGWGTHEENPENGEVQGSTAFLYQPGVSVLMKSWVPQGGQYNGFCIQHSEAVTLSEYFTTEDDTFRPSVYYVYQPCDAAIASVHEMRGHELVMQENQRIAKDEISSGMDELGVLLIGDDFAWWHGSQLDIKRARDLVQGENATSIQVASSMVAAILWMIDNPRSGYHEPEDLPFEQILAVADHYWEPLISIETDWRPSQDVTSLFYREIDDTNPCRFDNFRVWT